MTDTLDRDIARYIRKLRKIKNIEVPRANASALNKVSRTIRARSISGVSAATKVPQKILRNRMFLKTATSKRQTAELRGFVRPVSASALLTKSQIAKKLGTGTNKRGVTAKGYQWQGAFIQRGKSDNIHVFKRSSAKRLPIEVIKIPVDDAAKRIVPKVVSRVMKNNYRRLLAQDLRYRISKYEVK